MPKVSEQHRQDRREQILDAALASFVARGFQATSMTDVFEAAGLSAGAVYSYFPSKQELAIAVAKRAIAAQISAALASSIESGPDVTPTPTALLRAILHRLHDSDVPPSIVVQLWGEAATDSRFLAVAIEGLRAPRAAILGALGSWLVRVRGLGEAEAEAGAAELLPVFIAIVQGSLLQSTIDPDFAVERYLAGAARLFGE
jgi:AcrR family transcriptional regulator